jgi:hypothetical protein
MPSAESLLSLQLRFAPRKRDAISLQTNRLLIIYNFPSRGRVGLAVRPKVAMGREYH